MEKDQISLDDLVRGVLKEIVIDHLMRTHGTMEKIDKEIIGELIKNREKYTNCDVFRGAMEMFGLASEGIALKRILESYCELSDDNKKSIELFMKDYWNAKEALTATYLRHRRVVLINNISISELDIESFEKPQNTKLSKKDFDAISFGNWGYSKSSIINFCLSLKQPLLSSSLLLQKILPLKS